MNEKEHFMKKEFQEPELIFYQYDPVDIILTSSGDSGGGEEEELDEESNSTE